jgi:F-type H+-transporting ATPase subunit b
MSRLRFTYPALLGAILVLVLSPLAALAQETAAQSQPASATAAEVSSTAEVAHTSGSDEHGEAGHSDDSHGDASHGAHQDNDPTHANASDPLYKVIDWRTDMAFFSAVVFGLLLLVLGATAWKPIMQGLEKRERGIADNIAQAQKSATEATAKLAEYEAKLAAAAEESQRILAEARKDAEAAGQKLIAAAQEEAARGRDRAVADIESAKRAALGDLANQSTVLAMSLAQRVVGREVRAEDHQGLIQDMLSKLPSQN